MKQSPDRSSPTTAGFARHGRLCVLVGALLLSVDPVSALSVTEQATVNLGALALTCQGSCQRSTYLPVSVARFDSELGVLSGASLGGTSGAGTFTYTGSPNGYSVLVSTVAYQSVSRVSIQRTSSSASTAAILDLGTSQMPFSYLTGLVGAGQVQLDVFSGMQVAAPDPYFGVASGAMSAHTLTASLTYDYLRHANASFAAGSDSNTLSLRAGDSFSVHALGTAAETTQLDTLSIDCTGQCEAFNLGLASFQDLVAGKSTAGSTALRTGLAAGSYSAVYTLLYADDDSLGVGQRQNTLTLNLLGNVAAVPEPASGLLLLAGLGSLGALRRRLGRA